MNLSPFQFSVLGRYIHSKPFFPLQIKSINTENEILAKFFLSVIVIDTSIVFLDVKPKCFAWVSLPRHKLSKLTSVLKIACICRHIIF